MKTFLFALTCICILLSTSANGQNNQLRTDIPFPFVVSGTAFPAGSYEIRGLAGAETFMRIQNIQTGQTALVPFRSIPLQQGKRQPSTKLILMRESNQCVLHQVRLAGDSHTHDVIQLDVAEPVTAP